MNVKITDLLNFPIFFSKVKTQKLSFKTAYRLTLLAKEVEKHISFYKDTFGSLVMEYGKKDEQGNLIPTEDGGSVLIQEGKIVELQQKIYELDNLVAELPDTYFALDDFEGIELSPEEMVSIIPFIKE